MSLKKLPWIFSSDTSQLFENERFLFDHGSPCDREVVEPKIIDSGLSNGLAALPGVWGPGDKGSAGNRPAERGTRQFVPLDTIS
jgi:hypothetical protein